MAAHIRHFDFARDADALVSWLPDLYEHNFPGFRATPEFIARRRQALREAVRSPGQQVLVAQDERGRLGFVWLVLEIDLHGRRRGEVAAIYVVPRLRHQGLGRLLMEEAEATFRSWGCAEVHLMVTAQNAAALGLYDRLGYAVTRHQMEKRLR